MSRPCEKGYQALPVCLCSGPGESGNETTNFSFSSILPHDIITCDSCFDFMVPVEHFKDSYYRNQGTATHTSA